MMCNTSNALSVPSLITGHVYSTTLTFQPLNNSINAIIPCRRQYDGYIRLYSDLKLTSFITPQTAPAAATANHSRSVNIFYY